MLQSVATEAGQGCLKNQRPLFSPRLVRFCDLSNVPAEHTKIRRKQRAPSHPCLRSDLLYHLISSHHLISSLSLSLSLSHPARGSAVSGTTPPGPISPPQTRMPAWTRPVSPAPPALQALGILPGRARSCRACGRRTFDPGRDAGEGGVDPIGHMIDTDFSSSQIHSASERAFFQTNIALVHIGTEQVVGAVVTIRCS